MKRLFLCAVLAALMLTGCAGMKIHRGLDASGSFVSTAVPSVTVAPGEGFSAVTAGRTICNVPEESGMQLQYMTEVWYSLHKGEQAQLAVFLAECSSPLVWNISATGVEYQAKPLLYKFYGEMPSDATVLIYTRNVAKDPWMPLFAQAGSSWEGETLVARYEWMDSTSQEKLVVEYREPAVAAEGVVEYPVEYLNDFLKRSQKAFTLSGVQGGVQVVPVPHTVVSDYLLAPVVGSVTLPEPIEFDVD